MRPARPPILATCLALCALLAACASAPEHESSIIRTLRAGPDTVPFRHILVVSAAGDRASRLRFERDIAALLADEETTATPLFAVVGRYSPISRNILNNAVRAREFDAILLVRRLGQEDPDLAPGRPTGRHFNLYLYDYEELNYLTPIDAGTTIAFVAELYDTAAVRKIWAIESLLFKAESLDAALSTQVSMIAGQLEKDQLIAR